MKLKNTLSVVLCHLLLLNCSVWTFAAAEDAPVPVTTITSENLSSGSDVFLTLTRNAHSRNALPTSADTVTPENIQVFDAQNAGEAVARQTSVQTFPTGHLGFPITARLRGSLSTQTLLLVDGRPYTGVSLGAPDLSEIPVESIDRIEIVRGGVSALYGPNAIGGVINVITKRGSQADKPTGHVGYEMASFGYHAVRFGVGSHHGPVDYFLSGSHQQESGFRDNSDARNKNVGGNVGYSMGRAGKVMLDLSAYHSYAHTPGGDIAFPMNPNLYNNKDEKLASTPVALRETDNKSLRLSYALPLSANSLMTLRGFGHNRQSDYEDPTFVSSSLRHESSRGGEAQFDLPWGFMVGGSFIHDRLDNEDRDTRTSSFIRSTENWGVFVQETFKWKSLTLIPSGRFDHHSQFGETKNPRVQLIEDATDWLRFSGSAGRSFRAPTLDELYTQDTGFFTTLGNANLRPETGWTYDAGVELHNERHSARATYFRANISNLIQTQQVSAFTYQSVNVGDARRQGMELQLEDVLHPVVRHSVNYTYLENRGTPPGFNHRVTLKYSPRHTVNSTLTLLPLKDWKIDSTLRYVSSRYDGEDEGNGAFNAKVSSYVLWNMRAAYTWKFLEAFVGVNDLTDKRYAEQPGFPLPGRTYFGGLTARFGAGS